MVNSYRALRTDSADDAATATAVVSSIAIIERLATRKHRALFSLAVRLPQAAGHLAPTGKRRRRHRRGRVGCMEQACLERVACYAFSQTRRLPARHRKRTGIKASARYGICRRRITCHQYGPRALLLQQCCPHSAADRTISS